MFVYGPEDAVEQQHHKNKGYVADEVADDARAKKELIRKEIIGCHGCILRYENIRRHVTQPPGHPRDTNGEKQ